MAYEVLILPGFGNSGVEHWQTLWEQSNPNFKRVEQKDWNHPICHEWVSALEESLKNTTSDVILVAHSMACLVVAFWASKAHVCIKGALLVGVPDPKSQNFPIEAQGFEDVPMLHFDFPSIVVASSNDVYATLEYAINIANIWGSDFVAIGEKGHINSESGLGYWDEGYALFEKLVK